MLDLTALCPNKRAKEPIRVFRTQENLWRQDKQLSGTPSSIASVAVLLSYHTSTVISKTF
jgi:hypothetical protein